MGVLKISGTIGTIRQLFFTRSEFNVQSSIFNVQCSQKGSQIGGFSDENKHLSTKIYQYIYINVYI